MKKASTSPWPKNNEVRSSSRDSESEWRQIDVVLNISFTGFTNTVMKTAIVNIGQLATLAGPQRPRVGSELLDLGLIANAVLLIEEGSIVAAGPYDELRAHIPSDAKIIDACGRLITPGFVDAHTHLVFAGNRAAEFEQRIAGAT